MYRAEKKELTIEEINAKRDVVFLDFEILLQPYNTCNWEKENQGIINRDDIEEPYYIWNRRILSKIYDFVKPQGELFLYCSKTNVLSDDEIKSLLKKLHITYELNEIIRYDDYNHKIALIKAYLDEQPGLDYYVILDNNQKTTKYFREYAFYIGEDGWFSDLEFYQAKRIIEYGPWWNEAYEKNLDRYSYFQRLVEDKFKKVIFLDIDGVLNDDDGGPRVEKKFVANLSRIVEATGAEIILSSSWRNRYIRYARDGFTGEENIDKLIECFDEYNLKIAGATPVYFDGPDGRPFEIRAWLYRRADVEKFIILDDDTFWKWAWLEPYFVCTKVKKDKNKYVRGLNDDCVEKAINLLR